ncbi:MAG TPA: hypothetical protein DCM28_07865 [Phycisphaerales bacterium]|nr:hypothetical protein [Phycisphaerales bacterium]HCD31545.1 hypothetical protein [Phycisphaerales bacterium]
MSQRPLLTSLVKATQVMDLLIDQQAQQQGITLSAIAQQMQLPLNSVHSILRTLCACGYARQVKRGEYALGGKLLNLIPEPQLDESLLRPWLTQRLKRCVNEQREGYVCSILRRGERHVFAHMQSKQAVGINQTVLDDAPFYSKVSCRVLTAFCTKQQREQLIAKQGLPGDLWPEASTPQTFDAILKEIRDQGYLLMPEQTLEVVTIACPLFTRQGTFWGAIGSYAPMYRMRGQRLKQWLDHLRHFARQTIIET